ncbi:hypothetical protein NV64_17880 [Erwinia sp. B116]|nr:hypothetical protein NV64_17880 [Erwinia sp. B116]
MALVLPLSGCAVRPDYTLSPPPGTEWITLSVKLPPQTEVIPMDVLYRSEKCQREVYDQGTESHTSMDRGKNPQLVSLSQRGKSNIWQAQIALNGGGKCEWQLSAVRVDIQPVKTLALATGKKIIPTSYVFGFDDEAYGGGEGSGSKKETRGDLNLQTELFPVIFINHMFNETTFEMFGGDTRFEKWSRYFRVFGTKEILISPTFYLQKVVTLESPKNRKDPAGMIITYPDGEVVHERKIAPDYEKLLSMKE